MGIYDPLIFGKNPLERIVSLEIKDGKVDIFTEQKDGTIGYEWMPHEYWLLANRPLNKNWKILKGDLHYKYGCKFKDKSDWSKQRYNKSIDAFGINDPKEAIMVLKGLTYFKGMKIDEVSVLAFDIESTSLQMDGSAKVLLISNTFRKNGVVTRKLFAYDDFKDEKDLFDAWSQWVREVNPAIVLGHNVFGYDFPYLDYCAKKAGTVIRLGRDDSELEISEHESKFRVDGSKDLHYNKSMIYGREIIDTMFLAYRYDIGKKYDNFKLKYIIEKEGLQVQDRQFYDAGLIRTMYQVPEEWVKIKKYAEHDADDALALFDLMASPYFYMTQSIPKSFQGVCTSATGSQLNSILIRSYLQNGFSIPKMSEVKPYIGAISFGIPGIYHNALKIDVSSLYPSIMLEYKIFNKFKDPEAHFNKMVEYFTAERLKNKKLASETKDRYYTDLEQSQKIFINSCYGLLGASLNFNSPKDAEFVTTTGREILSYCIEWAAGKPADQVIPKEESNEE